MAYFKFRVWTLCLLALSVTLGGAFMPTAKPQTRKGAVTGTVTAPSGSSIPDATVTLKDTNTGTSRETTTNQAGIYRFDAVDLGVYDLTISKSGFKDGSFTGITIQANRVASIDAQLQLGTGSQTVEVNATASELLQTSDAVRGGNLEPVQITTLPLTGLDSLSLMLTLPGAQSATTTQFSDGPNVSFNGTRARGNNFMIDGVENNDISVAGAAFSITNPDAIQEVSVQTSEFSAEYGRAGGAVVNQITRSGTNKLHGTANEIYQSQVFNATSNGDRLGGLTHPAKFVENTPDFTIGGPVVIPHFYNGRNKTFFFGAAQWDRFFSSAQTTLSNVPTPAGFTVLQGLSSACPNVASFLQALGSLRGDPTGFGNPAQVRNLDISVPAGSTTCNGTDRSGLLVQVGPANRSASQSSLDNNHLVRIDQTVSAKQTMNFRWLYDSNATGPSFNNFPGFDRGFTGRTLTGSFTDTYVFSPRWVNEFRFNYGRIGFNFPLLAPDTFHATLPNFSVNGFRGWGGATNIPQFRYANNWQYQDTVTWVHGRHTVRFGADFLRQLARQHPPFNERGSFLYQASVGASGLANFIDDFGGTSGNTQRQFGSSIYHPNLLRQSYFGEDDWKVTQSLTLNLGLRYEYFGQPANTFLIPAFTNWDPVNFAQPDHVNPDKNNLGPVVGLAWAPHFSSGVFGRMFGEDKTVIRGGFQISYDTFFNNLLSNIAGSSPNTLGGIVTSLSSSSLPRGTANFQSQFSSIQPTPPTALSPQTNLLDPNIRNPYTERWTLEVQRELPLGLVFDVAYVGAEGHKLFQTLDMNPFLGASASSTSLAGTRLHSNVGVRTMRASSANSNYHSLQVDVKRRYSQTPIGNLLIEGAYTYSHAIDTVSEVFSTDSTPSAFESAPQLLGFSPNIDRGNADFDRRQRLVLSHIWDIRGPKSGILGQILGYWTVGGVATFNTGAPYTVNNGSDRNGDGQTAPDRPDIGNPMAPITSRAIITSTTTCSSGFINPDTSACTTPSQVFWVEGTGNPNANTVGRNTLFGPGVINWDLSVAKGFKLSEGIRLDYRLDMFNALNHVNLGDTPTGFGLATVNGTGAGSFLNFGLMDAPGRTMRMGLKLSF